jgi:hypothetical protein
MHKQLLAAAVAALMFCPLLSAADAAKPAAAPKPAAAAAPAAPSESAQLDFFLGDWDCSGKAFASEMGLEHATTAKVHAVKAVGGHWLHINYDENKTAANAEPYHVGVYMGYDASAKQFVERCVDAFGGYCDQTSKGWSGDSLVFEGTAHGGPAPAGVRDTFVKKSAGELTHSGEMQGPDKQWAKTDEESCKKAK